MHSLHHWIHSWIHHWIELRVDELRRNWSLLSFNIIHLFFHFRVLVSNSLWLVECQKFRTCQEWRPIKRSNFTILFTFEVSFLCTFEFFEVYISWLEISFIWVSVIDQLRWNGSNWAKLRKSISNLLFSNISSNSLQNDSGLFIDITIFLIHFNSLSCWQIIRNLNVGSRIYLFVMHFFNGLGGRFLFLVFNKSLFSEFGLPNIDNRKFTKLFEVFFQKFFDSFSIPRSREILNINLIFNITFSILLRFENLKF